MELICPSCEARYAVPDGAIGRHGRQVTCTNCGHGWRAEPPLELEPAMAVAGGRVAETAEAGRAGTAEIHTLRPTDPSRHAQLAELRDMIAQVQSDDAAPEAPAPAASPRATTAPQARAAAPLVASEAPAQSELRRVDDIEQSGGEAALYQDPLRRRMAELDARAARQRNERERMRRNIYDRDRERSGSGAFLVGFLLTVLVGAALLAAYAMPERIIERFPQSQRVLTEYGHRVDDARGRVAEGYQRGRDWVMNKVGNPG